MCETIYIYVYLPLAILGQTEEIDSLFPHQTARLDQTGGLIKIYSFQNQEVVFEMDMI